MALFVKGQVANPGGRPKLPEHLRGVITLTRAEVVATLCKFFRMDATQLKDLSVNPVGITGLELSIVKNILDYHKLGMLLDQSIGKVVEQVAVYQGLGNPEDYTAISQTILDQLAAGGASKLLDVTPTKETNNGNALPGSTDGAGDRKV